MRHTVLEAPHLRPWAVLGMRRGFMALSVLVTFCCIRGRSVVEDCLALNLRCTVIDPQNLL